MRIVFTSVFLIGLLFGQNKKPAESNLWQKVFLYQSQQKLDPKFWFENMEGVLMFKADQQCNEILTILEDQTVEEKILAPRTRSLEKTVQHLNEGRLIFPIKEKKQNISYNYFSSSS